MWTYRQSTGELYRDTFLALGYSGKGECKNDPAAQARHNEGPIPCGTYEMGSPFESRVHGPYCIPLAPNMDNVMHGRSAFLIHGDSVAHPGEASEGCIIMSRQTRESVWLSGDHILEVRA